jgi:hypothetical protein
MLVAGGCAKTGTLLTTSAQRKRQCLRFPGFKQLRDAFEYLTNPAHLKPLNWGFASTNTGERP